MKGGSKVKILLMMGSPEPLVRGTDQTREVPLNIFDVVELGCKRVLDINDDDFPVRLTLVKESHDTEDLDLLHLPDIADLLTNLTDVEGIVVTLGFGLRVSLLRIFPRLRECQ